MVKRSRCKINVCQLFRCLANMLSGAFWLQSGNLGKDDAAAAIDSDELADCVSRVSIVAAQWCDDIDQIDINSVIALSGGAMAVDIGRSTRLNSSHLVISYAVFCLKKKT